MTERPHKLRKRRTRQHVIAAQSVNYVERFIVDAGFTAQRVEYDYGYDLLVTTFDEDGYGEPGLVYLQIKATDVLRMANSGTAVAFDLAVQDVNLWIRETMPVLLVVFDAQERRAWWLHIQDYFTAEPSRAPAAVAKTIRVLIPVRQRFGRRTVAAMRVWKQNVLNQSWGRIDHA